MRAAHTRGDSRTQVASALAAAYPEERGVEVGLELPGELTEPLGWIGLSWPAADELRLLEQQGVDISQVIRSDWADY